MSKIYFEASPLMKLRNDEQTLFEGKRDIEKHLILVEINGIMKMYIKLYKSCMITGYIGEWLVGKLPDDLKGNVYGLKCVDEDRMNRAKVICNGNTYLIKPNEPDSNGIVSFDIKTLI